MKNALKAGFLSAFGILFLLADAAYAQTKEANAHEVRVTASNAAAIPGRVSTEQLRAILAAADQEGRQAFSDLVMQTAALPNALLAIQKATSSYRNFASHPLIQQISSFQHGLGKSLQPKQVDDIVAMNQLLSQCLRIFGSLAPPSSFNIHVSVNTAIEVERRRQERVASAKRSIIDIEGTLDQGDLSSANELYQRLANGSALPDFAENYLKQIQALGLDLSSYAQATQFDHRRNVPLLQQVLTLGREVNMLRAFESGRPLTKKHLEDAIKSDTEAVRIELSSLPTFQFNETSYRFPSVLSDSDKLSFVSSHIENIDNSLASVSETRAIVAQPEAVKTVEEVVGGKEAAKLNATISQIAAAERVRASLVDAQSIVQAKVAAEDGAREQRITAEKENEAEAVRAARAKREAEVQATRAAEAERNHAADKNCHEVYLTKTTAADREQFARDAVEKMAKLVGPDVIYVTAAGDDKEYLLFVATPENDDALRQVAAAAWQPNISANFCMQRFAQVQFIVRDANLDQRLVKRYTTSAISTLRYASQRAGAQTVK